MPVRVLFVCAQNICRSPLMAAAFLGALQPQEDWVAVSAGVKAAEGRHACRVASDLISALAEHRSTALGAGDIDAADLVIAASLAERAAVARLRPHARTKTFTLREALLLGEQEGAPVASVAAYAARLDARRGMVEPPRPSRLPWRRASDAPLDVVDVHGAKFRVHRDGLERAAQEAALLAQRLQRSLRPTRR